MQAQALHKHLRWTSVLLVFLVTACVATSAPRIRACAAGGSAASKGVLRILPSRVQGVEIDSAYWSTSAGTQDFGSWEHLIYYSRLRTTRTVRRSELAIVYEPGSSAGWDGRSTIALAAINVGDTTLTDMIVALVVVGPTSVSDTAVHGAALAAEDTIEYHIGPVAARGRVGFVGGALGYREGIVERLSYPAASVTGRTIPRLGNVRRVSRARAVERERRAVEHERQSDSLFERARATDVLWTDSLRYVAQRGREVTPGVYEYQLTLIARWHNPMPVPLYLPRCVAGGAPAYTIVTGTTREERTAYTPASSCAEGIRALRIGPDSARVDTLHLRALHAARPAWNQVDGPRAEGMFRLLVDVLTCDDGTPVCRPPRQERLSRSRPFYVRLGLI